jgi:hypothetical protein
MAEAIRYASLIPLVRHILMRTTVGLAMKMANAGRKMGRAGRGVRAAEILEKTGGAAKAVEDFNKIQAVEKTIGPVRVKYLVDGTKVILRISKSKDGRPTIEIQYPTGENTRIRYNP